MGRAGNVVAVLGIKTIEERVKALAGRDHYTDEILFDLLTAYGRSKSNITRLRNGSINVAEHPENGEYAQKNTVYYHPITPETDQPVDGAAATATRETQFLTELERLRTHERVVRFSTRFIIITDYTHCAVLDTKTNENRVFPLAEIDKHYAFFLPWAGMEKAQFIPERPADTKAAERMGELFDALHTTNTLRLDTDDDRHGLNIFFTRLLFCYFAEDTGLFPDGSFTKTIASHTREDGADTAEVITEIFNALDQEDKTDLPAHLQVFPYVNGSLFSKNASFQVPSFDKRSRDLLIHMGRLIWQDINPDIFGSMFQAVVHTGARGELGQHYTSVPNILKTIEPLFLDELREEFDKAYSSTTRLERLLDRIGKIKVFDPACGSGNFLVIAYKELRRLEHAILDRLAYLSPKHQVMFTDSVVRIDHFYGIEIDDFAAEVAVLALWIAKHQMNTEFKEKFGAELPLIPLKQMGQITRGNACRMDWETVCPHEPDEEVYLIGNPPYVGSSMQTKEQKEDLAVAYGGRNFSKNNDYISSWFIKGAEYIQGTRASLAFVSTNSVTQGDHVANLFPAIFDMGVEIGYAYTSFRWSNAAKHNAGVTVVVISLRNQSPKDKVLYSEFDSSAVDNISPYLTPGPNVFISRRTRPLCSSFPPMLFGSKATDGGSLNLSTDERIELLEASPEASRYVLKYVGASEFIRGEERYCLWIDDDQVESARKIPEVKRRLDRVSEFRLVSKAASTREYAIYPHRFRQRAYKPTDSIIVPSVSSERRTYVPIGFLGPDTVVSNLAFAVYDAEPWLFAMLTSKMHMAWLRAVGGKMKTDYRYSNTIVYNNFPVPPLSDHVKEQLTQTALRILDVREYYCERTLAELYDPEKMPELLCEAHVENDVLVDSIYREGGCGSDDDRLAVLFSLYEEMSAQQEAQATQKKKSTRKKKQ